MSRPLLLEGRCILVVEDEFFIADDMSRQLQEAGADVLGPFSTVQAALAKLDEGATQIDLGLLDVNLGGVASYEIADRLKARSVPVMLVTGYDSPTIAAPYRDLPHMQKPVTGPPLIRRPATLIQG